MKERDLGLKTQSRSPEKKDMVLFKVLQIERRRKRLVEKRRAI